MVHVLISVILSIASAMSLGPRPPNLRRDPAMCDRELVSEQIRFVVAYYYDPNNGEKTPVEVREHRTRGTITVHDLLRRTRSPFNANRVSSGPRIYLHRTPIIQASGSEWQWAISPKPNHFGPAAQGLWSRYHEALVNLVKKNGASVDEVMRSELHQFEWNDRVAYLIRLPVRDPNQDERFRPMWLFANEAPEPITIGAAVDSLRLNGEFLAVNQNRVYRFEDSEARINYVFEPQGPSDERD